MLYIGKQWIKTNFFTKVIFTILWTFFIIQQQWRIRSLRYNFTWIRLICTLWLFDIYKEMLFCILINTNLIITFVFLIKMFLTFFDTQWLFLQIKSNLNSDICKIFLPIMSRQTQILLALKKKTNFLPDEIFWNDNSYLVMKSDGMSTLSLILSQLWSSIWSLPESSAPGSNSVQVSLLSRAKFNYLRKNCHLNQTFQQCRKREILSF